MKPRVVILSAFISPFRSGAEACSEEVPLALKDQFDFTIVTARLRSDLPALDLLQGKIPVVRVGFGIGADKLLYPLLAPFAARRLRPQLLHAVLESYAGLALIFSRWIVRGVKRIMTMQSTNTSLFLGPMHRAADEITVISSVLARRAQRYGRNSVLIPNGVQTAAIDAACARYQKVPGRILFVGRLEPVKGVDTLIRAFAELAKKGSDAHLRIVGDGSSFRSLVALVAALNLSDRVTFAGRLAPPALYTEFAQAEIFCGLSRSEALGNVFLEAQAAGCAVIGTNVGGIPDSVADGATGLLVPPENPGAAARALERLLENTELRRQLAEAGRAHARGYDWNLIAERYAKVYTTLLR
jgi:glycosyltransferase involved in cell wall biosynthesis